jgi:hypothetical protein
VQVNDAESQYTFAITTPIQWADVTGTPCSRAWVFQERFLAHRTVHYTQSQVFWECKTQTLASESSPAGYSDQYLNERSNLGRDDSLRRKPTRLCEAQELWQDIINIYSRSVLTYGRDKLVALSRVADWLSDTIKEITTSHNPGVHQTALSIVLRDFPEGDFLAGIQLSNLAQNLCWGVVYLVKANNSPRFPAPHIAPSWSWASHVQPVVYTHSRYGNSQISQ